MVHKGGHCHGIHPQHVTLSIEIVPEPMLFTDVPPLKNL